MKTVKYSAFLLIVSTCLYFASCSYTGKFTEVKVANKFAMSFPDYMEEETEKKLGENASLQYCNYFRNIYTLVNEYPINDTLQLTTLAEQQYNELVKMLNQPQKVSEQNITINGLPALQYKVTGNVGEGEIVERIYYTLTIVKGKKQYYEIVFWTWDKWREKYLETITQIIQSFKEL